MTNKPDTLPEGRGGAGAGASVPDRATHEPNPQAVSALSGEYPSRDGDLERLLTLAASGGSGVDLGVMSDSEITEALLKRGSTK